MKRTSRSPNVHPVLSLILMAAPLLATAVDAQATPLVYTYFQTPDPADPNVIELGALVRGEGGPLTYVWDFGDGTRSTHHSGDADAVLRSESHRYPKLETSQSYRASLTVYIGSSEITSECPVYVPGPGERPTSMSMVPAAGPDASIEPAIPDGEPWSGFSTAGPTADLTVVPVPWSPGCPSAPHPAIFGSVITFKAIARNVSASATFQWDFNGDGSWDTTPVTITDPYNLGATYTFSTNPGYDVKYISKVRVVDGAFTAIGDYPILVSATSNNTVRINMAMDDALWYLHAHVIRAGSDSTGTGYWRAYYATWYYGSPTGSAVQAFENAGHKVNGDYDADPYVETARRGLNYILSKLVAYGVGSSYDSNGNGQALYYPHHAASPTSTSHFAYQGGPVMMALASCGDSTWVAKVGDPTWVLGRKSKAIVEDMADYFAWSQYDGSASWGAKNGYPAGSGIIGGWRYTPNTAPDHSAAQWPGMGLEAAEAEFGVTTFSWVRTYFENWLKYCQNANGGVGYTNDTSVNVAKTGAGIASLAWAGVPAGDQRVTNATNYINTNWNQANNFGALYAMYSVMKGMVSYGITNTGSHDWYDEYANWLLSYASRETASGSYWEDNWLYTGVPGRSLATAQGVMVLQGAIHQALPVAVALANGSPDSIGTSPNAGVVFSHSESCHPDPAHHIVLYEWDWESDGIYDYSTTSVEEQPTHAYQELGPYVATLRVTDDNTPQLTNTDNVLVRVSEDNNPPVAVPGGPYVGYRGIAMLVDGSGSYDTDPGDYITRWDWDLDADGSYEVSATVPETLLTIPPGWLVGSNHPLALRVLDSEGAADVTTSTILVNADRPDLALAPPDISASETRPCEGRIVTISANIHNTGNLASPDFQVLVFDGDPDSSGVLLQDTTLVGIPAGAQTQTSLLWPTRGMIGEHAIHVLADRANLIMEISDANNRAALGITVVPDTIPPTIAIVSGPEDGSVQAATDATYCWQGSDNATPSEELLYSFQMDGQGFSDWSHDVCTSIQGLTEGVHHFDFRVRDWSGSITWTSRSLIVDLTDPTTDITEGPPQAGWINANTATFSYTGADSFTSPDSLRFAWHLDGSSWSAWSHERTQTVSSLLAGPHLFEVKSRDRVGHEDQTPASRGFNVDLIAPETQITAGPSPGDTVAVDTLAFEWTGTDDQTPVGSLLYSHRVDGGPSSPWSLSTGVTLSALADGHHVLEVRAQDLATNSDPTPAVVDFHVDKQAPSVTILVGPEEGSHQSSTSATFIWTANDIITPRDELLFSYRLDGVASAWSRDSTAILNDLPEGTHAFEARAKDERDHVGTRTRHFTVDLTPSNTEFLAGPPEGGWITRSTTSFNWRGLDNLSLPGDLRFCYRVDGGEWTNWSTGTTIVLQSLAEGDHVFEVKSRDKALNEDQTPAVRSFHVGFVDLDVTAFEIPESGNLDRPIHITWTVSNNGNGPVTGTWYDRIYVSTDNLVGNDTQIAEFVRPIELGSGESYAQAQDVTVPNRPEGDYWLIVTTDGRGQIFEEGLENNNSEVDGPIQLSIPQHPDLQVTEVTHTYEGWSGQNTELSWRVRNYGLADATGEWKDRVYLSSDTLVGSDVLLGTFPFNASLGPNEEYQRLERVSLPPDISGNYWIIVTTDALDDVEEYALENNNDRVSADPFLVLETLYPDLIVESVLGPPEANAGSSIQVDWVVRNVGGAATDAPIWYDRVYLSPQPTIVPGQTHALGSFANPTYLPPGSAYQNSRDVTIPNGIAGIYYLIIKTDVNNHVNEHGREGNNTRAVDTGMTVRYLTAFLRVNDVQIPPSGWSGDMVDDVRWIVENVGETTFTSNHWNDELVLSPDAVLGGPDISLGSGFWHDTPLSPGERDTLTASVRLPEGISGMYHLFVMPNVNRVNDVQGLARSDSIQVTLSPPPDLTVTSLTAPDSVHSGSPIQVSWQVTNEGAGVTGAPQWRDAVYLSADLVLDLDQDILLGSYAINTFLPIGASYSETRSPSVPSSIWGEYYILICTDTQSQVFEGPWEDNNCRIEGPITIYMTPPDLEVAQVQALAEAWSGTAVPVRWVVQNTGTGTTSPDTWKDAVYFSNDDVLDPSQDDSVGTITHSGALAPGASYADTAAVQLADGISGSFYLFVVTDTDNAVYEYGGEDNNSGMGVLSVQLTPPPDLQVASMSQTSAAWSGQPLSIGWAVRNAGTGRTGTGVWTDALFFSADSTFDTGVDPMMSNVPHTGVLEPDSSYTATGGFVIPNGTSGSRYVFLWTDRQDQVYEHGQEPNNLHRIALDVQFTPPPDLLVTQVTPSGEARSGQPLSLAWVVRNSGPGATGAETWKDCVFLSLDELLTSLDTPLGTVPHSGPLAPDSSYTSTLGFTIPNGLSGPHYLIVFTDSTDVVFEHTAEGNNQRAEALSIELTPPPDLRVASLQGPGNGAAGASINVQWSVSNSGTGATRVANWLDRIYLSSDMTLSPGTDSLLAGFPHTGALEGGQGYLESKSITLPSGVDGTRYLICQTDAQNAVYEHNRENNNTNVTPIEIAPPPVSLPDLLAVSLAVTSKTLVDRQMTAGVQWTVRNDSDNPIPPSQSYWSDGFYLSADQVLDAYDTFLGAANYTGGLAPHGEYTKEQQLQFPNGASGNYFLIMVTDHQARVTENSEGNNRVMTAVQIALDLVDLVVEGVEAPDFVLSGQYMRVSWTVLNQGQATTEGSNWYDQLYLSRDLVLDENDHILGSQRHNGALPANQSYQDSLEVLIPLGFSDYYFVLVKTDKNNQLYEHGAEGNNLAWDAGRVHVLIPAPADLVVTSVEVPSSGTSGDPVTISWQVSNIGANPAPDRWTDALYLSTDDDWDLEDPPLGSVEHHGGLDPGKSYLESYTGNITTDLPGVLPGQYHVIVRTDVRNNVFETDEENNQRASDQAVDVGLTTLALGVPYDHQISTNQEQYFGVLVPLDQDIHLQLQATNPHSHLKLYVGYGTVPTRASFTSVHDAAPSVSVVISGGGGAGCYLTIYGEYAPGAVAYTIQAQGLPFGISSVTPSRGGDTGLVSLTLAGGHLSEATAVFLRDQGGAPIPAFSIWSEENPVEVFATFDTRGLARTSYGVCAVSALGDTAVLSPGFTIESGDLFDQSSVSVIIEGATVSRPYTEIPILLRIKNLTNVDIRHLVVLLHHSPGSLLTTTLPLAWPGEEGSADSTVGLMVFGLGPSEEVEVPLTFRSPGDGAFSIRAEIGILDEEGAMSDRGTGTSLQVPIWALERLDSADCETPQSYEQARNNPPPIGTVLYQYSPGGFGTAHEAIFYGPGPDGQDYVAENMYPGGTKLTRWSLPTEPDSGFLERTKLDEPNEKKRGWLSYWKPPMNDTQRSGLRIWVDGHPHLPFTIPFYKCTDYVNDVLTKGAGVNYVPFHNYGHSPNEDYRYVCGKNIPRLGPKAWNLPGPLLAWQLPLIGLPLIWSGEIYQGFVVRPRDPNEKLGPAAPGGEPFVSRAQTLPYAIYFENVPDAAAPAQNVRILDSLEPVVDWRRFRLGEIAFGDTTIALPPGRTYFHGRVSLESGFLLEIDAGLDVLTGQAHWYLSTIDPATGLPPTDPMQGFLPPNDSTGVGEGHVTFTIYPRSNLATGTEILNSATIVFDENEPIVTNTVKTIIRDAWPDLKPIAVDLAPEQVPPIEGCPIGLTLKVQNAGEVAADSIEVALFDGIPSAGGTQIGETRLIPLLGPGEEATVNADWTPARLLGPMEVYAVVDPGHKIAEEDENNNTWIAGAELAPRTYTMVLAAGLNFVAPPLEKAENYDAEQFAADLGASVIVGADSMGLFRSYVAAEPGDPFPVRGGEGYLAAVDPTHTVAFQGISHTGAVRIKRGLNLVSLPLEPESLLTAKALATRLGASQVVRLDPGRQVFQPFIPGFHVGAGFSIDGGTGYAVVTDRDTTVTFVGEGWMDDPTSGFEAASRHGTPASAQEETAAPELTDQGTTALLAVVGTVRATVREELVSFGRTGFVSVRNERTGAVARVRISDKSGHFSGAFLDLSGARPTKVGDVLVATLDTGDSTVTVEPISYTITAQDVRRHYANVGSISIRVRPSITLVESSRPNPARGSAIIRYQLAKPGKVSLKIFSVDGRLVRTLVDAPMEPGYYAAYWDCRNDARRPVASGVYVYRFVALGHEASRKMVILR